MTRFDLIRWRDLSSRDREAWRAFRAADRSLRSPYFDLGWCDAVASARGDLFVLRGVRDGRAAAFLPFHPLICGVARPAGGTFADWHGFVAEPGAAVLDVEAALRGKAATLAFSGAPEADRALAPWAERTGASHLVSMPDGFDAYARPKGRAAPKAIANLRRATRKLEADGREVRFVAEDRDPQTLAALIRLKSAQYRRSGHADTLSWGWSRRLMDVLFATRGKAFAGVLSSLWIDGTLAAAHLGLRSGEVMHHWLPAYDPQFAAYAPGNVLAVELARATAADGVTEIDLGQGDYLWKKEFANAAAPAIKGVVHGSGFAGRRNAATWQAVKAWSAMPVGRAAGWPLKALRRADRELSRFGPPPKAGGGPSASVAQEYAPAV